MVKVCILDYGAGNVKSVYNLVSFLGFETNISNEKSAIESATHIILPGVGSFGAAMGKIKSQIPISHLETEVIKNKKPFLGICVGMQVMAEKGFEHGEYDGLGWVSGEVTKLDLKDVPVPHIGWNDVIVKQDSVLFGSLGDIRDFYFVHSYVLNTVDDYILTETDYEIRFCSSIQNGNIFGVQFHPEKSQKAGQKLMQNFFSIS